MKFLTSNKKHFSRRFFQIFFLFLFSFLFIFNFAFAGGTDADGDGLIDISTAAELNNIRFNLNGTSYKTSDADVGVTTGCPSNICNGYELLNDINLSSYTNWSPIGVSDITNSTTITTANPFNAVFEGNGFSINNLNVNRSLSYGGLFANLNGIVRNVNISGNVNARYYSGILTGYASSTNISNVFVSGTSTSANHYVGGLVGWLNYGIINNSSSSVYVNGINGIGGLIGVFYNGNLSNTSANSVVNGRGGVGGLVGWQYDTISNSFSRGMVNGATSTGGLVGEQYGIIENSFSNANVTGLERTGGLVGEQYDDILNSYATGDVSGVYFVGGVVGIYQYGENLNNGLYKSQIQNKNGTIRNVNLYDDENTLILNTNYPIVDTSTSTFNINNVNDSQNILVNATGTNILYTLQKKIDNTNFLDISTSTNSTFSLNNLRIGENNFRFKINNTNQDGNYTFDYSGLYIINVASSTNNSSSTPINASSSTSTISGNIFIFSSSTKYISNALVSLFSSSTNNLIATTTTNNLGNYTFLNILNENDYYIRVSSSSRRGIAISDNVRNSRIISGRYTPSDFEKISADSNQDGGVAISDNVRNSRIISGRYLQEKSFLFFPSLASTTILLQGSPNKNYSLDTFQRYDIKNLSSTLINIDFKAVRIGDSNGDW